MLIKPPADIKPSDITPESVYLSRRQFIGKSSLLAGAALTGGGVSYSSSIFAAENVSRQKWQGILRPQLDQMRSAPPIDAELTPEKDVLRYNNFYEFGTDKSDPYEEADALSIHPWTVKVEGLCEKPGNYHLEDLLKEALLEERIYRLRCVEAWSMVIPWVGIPMATLLKKFEPGPSAKYVAFETLLRPEEMPGQRSVFSSIDWPYREGLRLDEAMHPLTLATVGLYGKILPNQNGAPIRLVVPWKYGFKSIKSIVGIRFQEDMPYTTWNALAPKEYGFYANVNPNVDHPRWSQKTERRLPGGFFGPRRIDTQMFNGYSEQVAGLYSGMDLRKFY